MDGTGTTRRIWLSGMVGIGLAGCRPGLGANLVSRDYAHTFTRRDLAAVHGMSTESFRRAVWNRVSPREFRQIARLMGHGRHMDVVDTRFDGDRALIQMRTENKDQYRLHLLRVGDEWLVEDVLEELEPAVYVSKRRQAEAVLAVRDFRQGLQALDQRLLSDAASAGFAREVWQRMSPAVLDRLADKLKAIAAGTDGPLGEVHQGPEGSPAATVNGHVFYFVGERGRLVVDDVALPKGPPTMRARLRNELSAAGNR